MTDIVDANLEKDDLVDDEEEPELTKGGVARGVIKMVASHSARFVISSAITTLVPVESKMDKRRVFIGSYVISGLVKEQVRTYVDNELNEKIEFAKDVMAYAKKYQAKLASEDPNP